MSITRSGGSGVNDYDPGKLDKKGEVKKTKASSQNKKTDSVKDKIKFFGQKISEQTPVTQKKFTAKQTVDRSKLKKRVELFEKNQKLEQTAPAQTTKSTAPLRPPPRPPRSLPKNENILSKTADSNELMKELLGEKTSIELQKAPYQDQSERPIKYEKGGKLDQVVDKIIKEGQISQERRGMESIGSDTEEAEDNELIEGLRDVDFKQEGDVI